MMPTGNNFDDKSRNGRGTNLATVAVQISRSRRRQAKTESMQFAHYLRLIATFGGLWSDVATVGDCCAGATAAAVLASTVLWCRTSSKTCILRR
jgi:hypothetical protein